MNEIAFTVVRYVTEHYADIESLDDVARRLALSPSSVSRYVKDATGKNFSTYLSGLRLEYAAHDLITTNRDVADISADNGFSSTSVFSRTFKAMYGLPPRDYRKRYATDDHRKVERKLRLHADDHLFDSLLNATVSMGSIATTGVPRFMTHVLETVDRHGFTDIRAHNLFSDFIYQRNRWNEQRDQPYDGYDFGYVDGIYDEFTHHRLTVASELSNRGWAVRQTFSQNLVTVAPSSPFTSLRQVKQAVTTLARHWKQRYSAERLNGWSFDLWHDPTLSTIDEFVLLLRDLRAEIRDTLPGCPVGGCALSFTEQRPLFDKFAAALERYHVTPDFVSICSIAHSATDSAPSGGPVAGPQSLRQEIEQAQNILHAHGVTSPLHICSWDPVPTQRNRYNDSSEKAAMLLQELSDCLDLDTPIVYGALTDFSSVYSDVNTLFFGANGLVSKDGFPKPIMHAFRFITHLPRHIIARGHGFVFAVDDDRSYTLLVWNRTGLNQQAITSQEYGLTMQQLRLMYRAEHDIDMTVELHDMPRNRYLLREYYVDDEHGNAAATSERYSVDGWIPPEDYRFIEAGSLPRFQIRSVTRTDGVIRFQIRLAPHGFAMVRLTEL